MLYATRINWASDSWLVKVRNNVIIMEGLAFRFKKKN